jgi:uncharacterized RDD family membrane protein YckC
MTSPDGTTSEPGATGGPSLSEGSPTRPPIVRPAVPPEDAPRFPPPPAGPYTWQVPPGYPPPPPGFPPPYPGGPYVRAYYPPPPPPIAPGGAPLAEVWERLVAYLVDYAILIAVSLIPLAIVVAALWSSLSDAMHRISDANGQAFDNGTVANPFAGFRHLLLIELAGFAILLPAVLVISYVYLVTMMHSTGQTVGKKIMKIQVVRATDGGPITLAMARKRWLVEQPAAMIAPYFSYADCLWLLWHKPYRQCLHDKCAETVVVKSNRE